MKKRLTMICSKSSCPPIADPAFIDLWCLFMCVVNFISVNRKLALCCKVGDTRIFSWNKFGFSLDSNSVPRPGVNLWKTKSTFWEHSFSFLTFEFETYLLSTLKLLLHAFKNCHSYNYYMIIMTIPHLGISSNCAITSGVVGCLVLRDTNLERKKKNFLFFKSK